MDDTRIQSALLAWIIPLAIAVSVYLRRDKDSRQKLFVLFALNVSLYYLFVFLHVWHGEPWFERVSLSLAVLLPQWGLRFFRAFSTGARGIGRLGRFTTGLGIVLMVVILYPSLMRPAVGPAVLAYVIGFMFVAIFDLNVQTKEATTRVDRARIQYLVVGGVIALSLQVVDHLNHVIDVDFPPIGLAMTLAYLYIISQTIVRYRILDLYEMIGRFAVLTLMGIVLAAIYTGLAYWAGKNLSINAFLSSLIILILFDPLRELVERKIADVFFRERRVLDQVISALKRRLAHVIDIQVMSDVLIDGLERSRRVTHAALYLIDPHGRGFDLTGKIGPAGSLVRVEAATARRQLQPFASAGALVATTLRQRRERRLQEGDTENAEHIADTLELLDTLQGDVLVLIQGEEQLLGLLTVRDERLNEPFFPEEIFMLVGLAGQVAITVENSYLYQQTKERDRLAALGQMAAGLAHEIRNPLGTIKASAQYIEDVSQNENLSDEYQEFLTVIVEEVDRLNRVVSDFLNYARPSSGRPRVLDANDILQRTVQLFETGHEGQVDLVLDITRDLPGVKIDGERLHQIFLNLILNAVQAMAKQAEQRLEISTRLQQVRTPPDAGNSTTDARQFVEVRFSDNGPGIAAEHLQNIFIPFFTTKAKGSGLGLSVCQRMVRDAGGDLEVSSRLGRGSIFTVVLPALLAPETDEP